MNSQLLIDLLHNYVVLLHKNKESVNQELRFSKQGYEDLTDCLKVIRGTSWVADTESKLGEEEIIFGGFHFKIKVNNN